MLVWGFKGWKLIGTHCCSKQMLSKGVSIPLHHSRLGQLHAALKVFKIPSDHMGGIAMREVNEVLQIEPLLSYLH